MKNMENFMSMNLKNHIKQLISKKIQPIAADSISRKCEKKLTKKQIEQIVKSTY